MNAIAAALTRTSRSLSRAAYTLLARLSRKATIRLTLTITLPPFVKLAVDYKADLSSPGNRVSAGAHGNRPLRRKRRVG